MPDPYIPSSTEMLLPMLRSIAELGGSARADELDEATVTRMGLTEEQVSFEFTDVATQRGSKVSHRLPWARTYLKNLGCLERSSRGVWALTAMAEQYLKSDDEVASARLAEALADWRRKTYLDRKGVVKPSHDAPEDVPHGSDLDTEPAAEATNPEDDAVLQETDWQTQLLGRLGSLAPAAFERLASRLLREAGFRNVEVTGRPNDGGIDGVGVYRPSLVSFPIYFQCKRYANSVGSAHVRDFRGAMSGRGEKGLLITTGTFTAEARREATRDGAPPVDLVDGADLCDLLKQYELGVSTTQVEHVEVHTQFFDSI